MYSEYLKRCRNFNQLSTLLANFAQCFIFRGDLLFCSLCDLTVMVAVGFDCCRAAVCASDGTSACTWVRGVNISLSGRWADVPASHIAVKSVSVFVCSLAALFLSSLIAFLCFVGTYRVQQECGDGESVRRVPP